VRAGAYGRDGQYTRNKSPFWTARLAATRLDQNLTQAALAEEAGVSKRTVERLESGEVAARLSGLVRVWRALGLLERFDALVPASVPSPIAQLKLARRRCRT
jgi:transcriptional regulator with XRE-family HTH domain